MKKIIFLCFILLLNKGLIASINNSPFESLSLSMELLKNVNNNDFHYFYESKNGLKTSITTPFYWGNIQASLKLIPFVDIGDYDANILIIQPNIKWGKNISLSDNVTWFNSAGLGINIFYFSDKTFSSIDEIIFFIEKTESEIGFIYTSILGYSLNQKIHLNLDISNDIIFTYKKINLLYVGMGMSYSIKTPNWIKLILE